AATLEYHQNHEAGTRWEDIAKRIRELRERIPAEGKQAVGVIRLSSNDIRNCAPSDPGKYFELRRSVRQFSDHPVSRELIIEAIRLARLCPSVCNRQTVKVYVYTNPDKRAEVLSFQDGNAGFGDQ